MKAFPWSIDNGESVRGENGMDLRDYFAANACIALTELLSHPKDVARNAYRIADAMMEIRNNETN
jgi:hypothetical protein